MIEKYTMNNNILSILIDRIHEEDLPINITTGNKQKDYNGDVQVDVLVECDDCDVELWHRVLNESVKTYSLSFNN